MLGFNIFAALLRRPPRIKLKLSGEYIEGHAFLEDMGKEPPVLDPWELVRPARALIIISGCVIAGAGCLMILVQPVTSPSKVVTPPTEPGQIAGINSGLPPGHCLAVDSMGHLTATGATCGSGGSGTVTSFSGVPGPGLTVTPSHETFSLSWLPGQDLTSGNGILIGWFEEAKAIARVSCVVDEPTGSAASLGVYWLANGLTDLRSGVKLSTVDCNANAAPGAVQDLGGFRGQPLPPATSIGIVGSGPGWEHSKGRGMIKIEFKEPKSSETHSRSTYIAGLQQTTDKMEIATEDNSACWTNNPVIYATAVYAYSSKIPVTLTIDGKPGECSQIILP